jgi:hypothetical protein
VDIYRSHMTVAATMNPGRGRCGRGWPSDARLGRDRLGRRLYAGLKAIADPIEGSTQSRAVSWHAAGVGVAGAASFAVADLFDTLGGPNAAFLFGSFAAMIAFTIAAVVMPDALPKRSKTAGALLASRDVVLG